MKNLESRIALHLFVLFVVVVVVAAALIVEGLGFALIVALGCGIVLAIGYPLLVILAERRSAERAPALRHRAGRTSHDDRAELVRHDARSGICVAMPWTGAIPELSSGLSRASATCGQVRSVGAGRPRGAGSEAAMWLVGSTRL